MKKIIKKKEANNTLVIGDVQLQSSNLGCEQLISLAEQTLQLPSIKSYLEGREEQKSKEILGMVK